MKEHIVIKKIKKGEKELIEMSFYGDYEVLYSLLYTSAKENKVLHNLIMDVAMEDMPPMDYHKINLN